MKLLSKRAKGGFLYSALILSVLVFSLGLGIAADAIFREKGIFYRCFLSLSSVLPLIAIIFISRRVWRGDFTAPLIKPCHPHFFALSLLLSYGMMFGLGFITLLIQSGLKNAGATLPADYEITGAGELFLSLLCLCALPAFFEELFFRGVLIDLLKDSKPVAVAVTVALSFSLYHTSAVQSVYPFLFGLGLCALTIKSGSILPAVCSHFLNNAAVILIKYFALPVDLFSPWFIATGIIALSAFYACLLFRAKKTDGESIKGYYLFAGVGFIFAVLIAVLGVVS